MFLEWIGVFGGVLGRFDEPLSNQSAFHCVALYENVFENVEK